ncbi:MAG TPA: carboxypeptidase regulatory-like domain-containing protein [Terriglobales bacterium]|nr:carboxypeptidase regulatory-like domain-containing protein [Terriglobales bacterium]
MKVRVIMAVVVILLLASALNAQTFRGTILGTITDQSGAVVSGAKVTAKNTATGLERTTQTSADGSYSIPELPVGPYTVTVSQSGFQTAVTTNVLVDVAVERRVDAQLKTGQVSQTVEVSGEALPEVETTSDTLGSVFTSTEVKNVPVNGRDYQKLIYLSPGVSGSPDQITDSPGSFGVFSMNGARGRSNNFLLDGTDMNDGYRNDPAINEAGVFGTPATILPVDAVGELRVISNFEPEYGRNAGAVINIVTKSGTNQLHGSAIEYFRNSALDARNFFNFAGQPKAQFHNNQFGGSLGGPIIKDKTFFFVNYEGQREKVGVVTLANVPTGTAPDGSLSPSQASNSVIAALLARHPWPAPNVSNGTGFNASVISPSTNRVDSMIGKIDHSFNPSNNITGRYYFGDSDQSFPLALTASGGQLPGFNTVTPTRVQLVSLSYVKVISSNKVNELRYGWNRFAEQFNPQDKAFHPSSIGLNTGSGVADQGLPIILVSGVAQLGATSGDPRSRVDTNNQLLDNFSWKAGKHDIKFGFEFRRTSVQHSFNKYFRGRLRFKDTTDANGNVTATALDNFLAGNVTDGFQYSGYSLRHTAENSYGAYVQDSFRINPRLTLNYGLRWDYFGEVKEKNNLMSGITAFDLANANFTLTQVGKPGLSQLYNPDKANFAPRVSVAWDTRGNGKTVIRAGYGIFYDAVSQDYFLGHLPYAPFFGPGPAYNNIGPAPITSAGAVGGVIVPGSAVYQNPAGGCLFECDTFTFDRNIHNPYMENYNLNVQQQIASKMVLQVGYVGSQGHHLWRFRDLNQPSTAQINAADVACACINDFGSAARPFRNNPYGAFYMLNEESTAKSNYNSLQTSFRVNQWRGVTSIVNYVWSHSLDDASDGEDFEPNAAQPNDSTRPFLEYGNSNFDLRQRFTWIFGYEVPKMGGSLARLKNGWGFNSTLTLQSGQPFHFNYNFQDDFSGSGNAFDRPDVVGPIVYHGGNPFNFIDLSSFAIPCDVTTASGAASDCIIGTRHFGNMRRGSLIGPNFKQWDFAVYKDTAITERLNMQLRAEIFNILNHPNFASPYLPAFIADPGINGFQQAGNKEVGVGGYPLQATGDVGVGNPFLGGGGPRGIQLAAKFTF